MTPSGEAFGIWPEPWLRRLMRRLQEAPGPVVQVWGWPGSGQRMLFAALTDRGGLEVPPTALSDPATLGAAAESARNQNLEYLLCRHWPGEGFRRGLEGLLSRPLIVFTSQVLEVPEPSSDDVVGPWELALIRAEISSLWQAEAGAALEDEEARRLQAATNGWLRPLILLARRYRETRAPSFGARGVVAHPEVQSLLEAEVLSPLSPASRQALLGLREPTGQVEAELRRRGFLQLDSEGRLRPPALLQALGQLLERTGSPSKELLGPTPEPTRLEKTPRVSTAPTETEEGIVTFESQFFGPPQVWRRTGPGEGHRVAWGLRRALKMFAFLSTRPDRRASRLNLVEAAFRDRGLESVRRNFHPTLSLLRRSLEEEAPQPLRVLRFREGFYELNREYRWIADVDEFQAYRDRAAHHRENGDAAAAVERWQKAWRLYRGPFLEGYEEGWILDLREALYRGYLSLLRDLGDALAELGRLGSALDAYRALLVEDPLQEAVQVSVMGLYAAQGRRDLVRRQYDRLARLLSEELGVEPLQSTTLAYHRAMG